MSNGGVVCLFTSQYDFFPISMNLHSFVWMRKTKILILVILLLNVTSCLQKSVAEDKWDFWRTSGGQEGVGVLLVSCCLLSCHPVRAPAGLKQQCPAISSSAVPTSQLPCNVQFNFLTRTRSWADTLTKFPALALRFNSLISQLRARHFATEQDFFPQEHSFTLRCIEYKLLLYCLVKQYQDVLMK